jgi:2-hydroxychromene-2-carboxylate isomerase
MAAELEYWFSYGSVYTYLTMRRITQLAQTARVEVLWRPYNLTVVFANKGIRGGPFATRPEKLAHMWRDTERRAKRYGFPYRKPEVYPVDTQSTVRVGYLAQVEGWCEPFSKRVFDMNFIEGRPIGAPGNLEAAIKDVGKAPERTIKKAHEPDNEAGLGAQTKKAEELGMFGSPHFLVDGDLYWGDDRLEDALEAAQTR